MTHSKLQTKRLEAQMSQSQLAAAAGVNGRMLQYYEQGAKDLSGAKLAHAAQAVPGSQLHIG